MKLIILIALALSLNANVCDLVAESWEKHKKIYNKKQTKIICKLMVHDLETALKECKHTPDNRKGLEYIKESISIKCERLKN